MAISITVAYATPEQQVEIPCRVTEDTTVAMAIRRCGILAQFPDIVLSSAVVGIYSRQVELDDLLVEGDRVEIYRPLVIDPKQARRLRAQRKS
jgi:uncharacterized protein